MSANQQITRAALFCNGFDGILSKVARLCREKLNLPDVQLLVYSRRTEKAFHAYFDLEDEVLEAQPGATIVRRASDCMSLVKHPFDAVIIRDTLGLNRTLLCLIIACLMRATLLELNLGSSSFERRRKFEFFGILLKRAFSRRTLNACLLSLSNTFKLTKLLGYPLNMHVETVAVCNLRCPACATGLNSLGRAQGFMDFDKYQRLVSECGPYLENLTLHVYGEPLLHKQITSFIRAAKASDARNIELSTNANVSMGDEEALKFVQSGLDTLIVSVDGADQEVYSTYRKSGKLSLVLDFIKTMVRAKQQTQSLHPIIMVQFIIMKHNLHQVEQTRQLVMGLGVDSFRTKMFDATFADIGLESALNLLPDEDAERSYRIENGKMVSKRSTDNNFCPIVWDTATLTWDGHLLPCVFDEKGSMVLSDTFHVKNSFREAWNSDQFVSFRKAILSNRKKIPLCKECPFV